MADRALIFARRPAPDSIRTFVAVDVCNHVAKMWGWNLSPGCGGPGLRAAARVAICWEKWLVTSGRQLPLSTRTCQSGDPEMS